MYPATHMTVAVAAIYTARRLTGTEANGIDYRIVALGSILPDMLDKPLKWFLFREQLPDDHVFGHTLAFSAALLAAGAALARRGEPRLLWLGLGSATHPFIDPVLKEPRTLFWPLLGTRFPVAKGYLGKWTSIAGEATLVAAAALTVAKNERARRWFDRFISTGAVR